MVQVEAGRRQEEELLRNRQDETFRQVPRVLKEYSTFESNRRTKPPISAECWPQSQPSLAQPRVLSRKLDIAVHKPVCPTASWACDVYVLRAYVCVHVCVRALLAVCVLWARR